MKLGITQSTNIHNTRSLIRTLKHVLDILQTEEAFMVEEYKQTHKYRHQKISQVHWYSRYYVGFTHSLFNLFQLYLLDYKFVDQMIFSFFQCKICGFA